MKKAFFNNPLFRIVWPVFYGTMVYLIILLVFDSINQLRENFFNQEMWTCVGLSYFFYETIRLEIAQLQKYRKLREKVWIWIGAQLMISIIVSALVISGILSVYFTEFVGYSFGTFDTELITFNLIFGVTAILYDMVFFGVYFLNIKNEARLDQENTLRKNLELQIQSFNNDINPRFLYSCLETLITLLYKKGKEAEKFVSHLSSVYRYVLQNKHNELTSLKAEIDSIKDLVYLFNKRFNDKITLSSEIAGKFENKQLVTGTLFAIVEDIVNNTIISESQGLHISCGIEEDNYLVFKNKLNEKLLVDEASRKRCENLRQTYAYFTSQPFFRVKAHDASFVKVPLIAV